jgi:hypothetical protein
MRIDLFPNGLIDDLVVEDCSLRIERTGDAKYTLRITGASALTIDVWGSRRFPLTLDPIELMDWIRMEASAPVGGCVVETDVCNLHLESMTRRHYWLGLSRDDNLSHIHFTSPGYVKARLLTVP